MPQNPKNYTDPDLREQVKQEVQQSDKGGKPGQWSARKAQMTASEYKARGGDYTSSKDEKKPEQKNLDQWGDEEWQTKEGSGTAKQDDGTRKRYLPKKAWEELDEDEKNETEQKKVEGSKKGKQFVGNTGKAKRKRAEASEGKKDKEGGKDDEGAKSDEVDGEEGEDEDEEEIDEQTDDEEEEYQEEDQEEEEREEGGEEDEQEEEEEDQDEEEEQSGKQSGKDESETAEQPDTKRRKKD
ncbi:hypothetical protein BDV18DRAFT_146846 [Aspergillus unguis]